MCNLEYFGSTVSLQWMEMFRNRWLAPLISYPKWKKVTENLKWIGKILHSAWPNNTAYTCAIWSTLAEQGTCGERNARNLLRAGLRSTAQVSGFTFYYGTESRFYGKLQKRPPDVILRMCKINLNLGISLKPGTGFNPALIMYTWKLNTINRYRPLLPRHFCLHRNARTAWPLLQCAWL